MKKEASTHPELTPKSWTMIRVRQPGGLVAWLRQARGLRSRSTASGSGTPPLPVAEKGGVEVAGETSKVSGEGTRPPPVAEMGRVDESSEREGRERQRAGTTIELTECEAVRRLSQMDVCGANIPYTFRCPQSALSKQAQKMRLTASEKCKRPRGCSSSPRPARKSGSATFTMIVSPH